METKKNICSEEIWVVKRKVDYGLNPFEVIAKRILNYEEVEETHHFKTEQEQSDCFDKYDTEKAESFIKHTNLIYG